MLRIKLNWNSGPALYRIFSSLLPLTKGRNLLLAWRVSEWVVVGNEWGTVIYQLGLSWMGGRRREIRNQSNAVPREINKETKIRWTNEGMVEPIMKMNGREMKGKKQKKEKKKKKIDKKKKRGGGDGSIESSFVQIQWRLKIACVSTYCSWIEQYTGPIGHRSNNNVFVRRVWCVTGRVRVGEWGRGIVYRVLSRIFFFLFKHTLAGTE